MQIFKGLNFYKPKPNPLENLDDEINEEARLDCTYLAANPSGLRLRSEWQACGPGERRLVFVKSFLEEYKDWQPCEEDLVHPVCFIRFFSEELQRHVVGTQVGCNLAPEVIAPLAQGVEIIARSSFNRRLLVAFGVLECVNQILSRTLEEINSLVSTEATQGGMHAQSSVGSKLVGAYGILENCATVLHHFTKCPETASDSTSLYRKPLELPDVVDLFHSTVPGEVLGSPGYFFPKSSPGGKPLSASSSPIQASPFTYQNSPPAIWGPVEEFSEGHAQHVEQEVCILGNIVGMVKASRDALVVCADFVLANSTLQILLGILHFLAAKDNGQRLLRCGLIPALLAHLAFPTGCEVTCFQGGGENSSRDVLDLSSQACSSSDTIDTKEKRADISRESSSESDSDSQCNDLTTGTLSSAELLGTQRTAASSRSSSHSSYGPSNCSTNSAASKTYRAQRSQGSKPLGNPVDTIVEPFPAYRLEPMKKEWLNQHFSNQLTVIEILSKVVAQCPSAADVLEECGWREKLVGSLCWVVLYFGSVDAAQLLHAKQVLSNSTAEYGLEPQLMEQDREGLEYWPFPYHKDLRPPTHSNRTYNMQIDAIVSTLENLVWVFLRPAQEQSNVAMCRLTWDVVRRLFLLQSPEEPLHLQAAKWFLLHVPELQFHVLDMLIRLLTTVIGKRSDPGFQCLESLEGIQDILFSKYMGLFSDIWPHLEPKEYSTGLEQVARLRTLQKEVHERVAYVVTLLAVFPHRENNSYELQSLVQVLQREARHPVAVYRVCGILCLILQHNFLKSVQRFMEAGGCKILLQALFTQQELFVQRGVALYKVARNSILNVVSLLIKHPKIRDTILAEGGADEGVGRILLECIPVKGVRTFALEHIRQVMVSQLAESLSCVTIHRILQPMIRRLCEMLARSEWDPCDSQLMWDILESFQALCKMLFQHEKEQMVKATSRSAYVWRKTVQKLFRVQGNCFLLLSNMLHFPPAHTQPVDWCCHVLRTLGWLLKSNPKAREAFASDIGYKALGTIVLECVKDSSTPPAIFQEFFALLCETEGGLASGSIQNGQILEVLLDLVWHEIKRGNVDMASEALATITCTLQFSLHNVAKACACSVLHFLLRILGDCTGVPKVQEQLEYLIHYLGRYSFSAKELKSLLSLLRDPCSTKRIELLPSVIRTLRNIAAQPSGKSNPVEPKCFFDFGERTSGIRFMSILDPSWPSSKGYSFTTWFRIEQYFPFGLEEPVSSPEEQSASSRLEDVSPQPRFYSFASRDGWEFETFFTSDAIHFRVRSPYFEEEASVPCKLLTRQWYHLSICHTPQDEGMLYLDGVRVATVTIPLPRLRATHKFQGFIGTDEEGHRRETPWHNLYGQMTSVSFLDEVLSPAEVQTLFKLGPDYSLHGATTATNKELVNHPKDATPMVAKLAASMLMAFHPLASENCMLFNICTAPARANKDCNKRKKKQESFAVDTSSGPKAMAGTILVACRSLGDAVDSIGGATVLLPLFAMLIEAVDPKASNSGGYRSPARQYIPNEVIKGLLTDLVALLGDILLDQPCKQKRLLEDHAMPVMNAWLSRLGSHLTMEAFRHLHVLLHRCAGDGALFREIIQWLFLDLAVWAKAKEVLRVIPITLLTDCCTYPYMQAQLRNPRTLQMIFDQLLWLHPMTENWTEPDRDRVEDEPNSSNSSSLPSLLDYSIFYDQFVRKDLLQLAMVALTGTTPISRQEAATIMQHVVHCIEEGVHFTDTLGLILEFLCRTKCGFAQHMQELGFLRLVHTLLAYPEEGVQCQGILIMGKCLEHLDAMPTDPIMSTFRKPSGMCHLVPMIATFSHPIYNALKAVLMGTITAGIDLNDPVLLTGDRPFEVPQVLSLLLGLAEGYCEDEALRALLGTELAECTHSNSEVCEAWLNLKGWQSQLYRLMMKDPDNQCGLWAKGVAIMVSLMYHALVSRPHGWQILDSTVAYFTSITASTALVADVITRLVKLLESQLQSGELKLEPESSDSRKANAGNAMCVVHNVMFLLVLVEDEVFATHTEPDAAHATESEGEESPFMPGSAISGEVLSQHLEMALGVLAILMLLNWDALESPLSPEGTSPQDGRDNPISDAKWWSVRTEGWGIRRIAVRMLKICILHLPPHERWANGTPTPLWSPGDGTTLGLILLAVRKLLLFESDPHEANGRLWPKFRGWFSPQPRPGQPIPSCTLELIYCLARAITIPKEQWSLHVCGCEQVLETLQYVLEIRHEMLKHTLKGLMGGRSPLNPAFNPGNRYLNFKKLITCAEWLQACERHMLPAMTEETQKQEAINPVPIVAAHRCRVATTFKGDLEVLAKETDTQLQVMMTALNNGALPQFGKFLPSSVASPGGSRRQQLRDAQRQVEKYWRGLLSTKGSRQEKEYIRLAQQMQHAGMRIKTKRDPHGTDHKNIGRREEQMRQALSHTDLTLLLKNSITSTTLDVEEEDDPWGMAGPEPEAEEKEPQVSGAEFLLRVDCELIQSMQAYSGRLEITGEWVYYFPDEVNRSDTQDCVTGLTGQLVPRPANEKWSIQCISELWPRRYRLQRCAVELFFSDGTSVFLNLVSSTECRRVYACLKACKPKSWKGCHNFSPEKDFHRQKITEKWRRREISNFEYLMLLNQYAGRSFNDLAQYPVLPWIIQDYESESLDLEDESIYRDLSLPIGALNAERLDHAMQRYLDIQEIEAEPFYWGSHYSTAAFVLYYLIRVEPYTSLGVLLQDGIFDHADRMFHSVGHTWKGVVGHDPSNVKELIPEFFTLPEMFVNNNGLDLGTRQDGTKMGDVVLPPWAKGSPFEFVKIMRQALESEYVSTHLDEWIDLIFGYKQRGRRALESSNLFYPLTYEGNVDWDRIAEEDRMRVLAHIDNFGQTPIQLFLWKHPKRGTYGENPTFNPFLHAPDLLGPCGGYNPVRNDSSSVKAIYLLEDKLIALTALGSASIHRFTLHPPHSLATVRNLQQARAQAQQHQVKLLTADIFGPMSFLATCSNPSSPIESVPSAEFSSPTQDAGLGTISPRDAEKVSGKSDVPWLQIAIPEVSSATSLINDTNQLANSLSRITPVSGFMWESEPDAVSVLNMGGDQVWSNTLSYGLAMCEKEAFLVAGGLWDATCLIYQVSGSCLQPVQVLHGHKDVVTCLQVSDDGAYLVTGSRDTTCILWGTAPDKNGINAVAHRTLFGHDDEVLCVALSREADLIVSGSKDGTVICHSLQGCYERTIQHPDNYEINLVAVANNGDTLMYSYWDQILRLYSINGSPIMTQDVCNHLHVLCITRCSHFLITGGAYRHGNNHSLVIRSLPDLAIVKRYDGAHCGVTSLDVHKSNQTLIAGLEDGSTLFFATQIRTLI